MKLSVIVATYNRAHGIGVLLDSIALALANALPQGEGEIVLIDNNSTDGTADTIAQWIAKNPTATIQHLVETRQGACYARNRGIDAARGALLAFTDDDCRLAPDFAIKALAHDAADDAPVIRGGRILLANATDLPLTITLHTEAKRWSRALRSARHQNLADCLIGCNMTMRKTTAIALGGLDTRFGPGTSLPAAEDLDLYSRAYLAGMEIAFAPDMLILHDHGRKTPAEAYGLMRNYSIANGGIYAKYIFRHPDFCRPVWWDFKQALREIVTDRNRFMPEYGFSHCSKLRYFARGMFHYCVASLRHQH